jgi:hypothetical protein
MKPKMRTSPYISVWLAIPIFLAGAIIPIQDSAIAQITKPDDSISPQLSKAQDVIQQFFTALVEGKYENARQYYSPSVKEYISAEDLGQRWQKITSLVGNFVKFKQIQPVKVFDTYTVLVTANFERSTPDFVITLDRNQQITAFDFLWLGNIQTNAEEFVDAVSTGKYALARSYLAPKLKETLLPEMIQQRWQKILASLGSFKRRSSSKVVNSSSSEVVLVNLEFEKYTGNFTIVFNPLGQIVGVEFPQKQP